MTTTTTTTRNVRAQLEDVSPQKAFKPTKISSFYGSQVARPHTPGKIMTDGPSSVSVRKRPRVQEDKTLTKPSAVSRPRRDYEIFREDQKKEIVARCPELMFEFSEKVFRSAARAIWDSLDSADKAPYQEKAAEEKRVFVNESAVNLNEKNVKGKRGKRAVTKKAASKPSKTVKLELLAECAELKMENPTRVSRRSRKQLSKESLPEEQNLLLLFASVDVEPCQGKSESVEFLKIYIMIFDANHHLFPPKSWEVGAAASTGFTITQFRFVIAFLVSIPIAYLFRIVPTTRGKHIYAIITGFLLIYYPFGGGCFHSLLTSSVVYVFMLLAPQRCGALAWFFAFPYLIINHINQASGMAWKEGNMDFTGAQMVLTLKLISIAMCYQDGVSQDAGKLHTYAQSKKLTTLPNLLEYFSYLFSIGNLLSGPCFEAKDYFDYINRRGDWDESKPECRIPNPIVPGMAKFIKSIMCATVWMYFTNSGLNIDYVEGPVWRNELPLWLRIPALWAVLVVYRFKYYAVWTVSECSMILCGFGYNKRDKEGNPRWDRYVTSRIRHVELNPSIADTPRHWNICTGLWLRHYVYERLSSPGSKPSFFNMIVTQLVSGVWHGVFAGYWLFFATSAFIFQASRLIFKYEMNWPSKWRNFYPWYAIKVVTSALVLNYAGSAFMVLSFDESILIWKSVYYFGHVWMAAVIFIGFVYPPKGAKKKET